MLEKLGQHVPDLPEYRKNHIIEKIAEADAKATLSDYHKGFASGLKIALIFFGYDWKEGWEDGQD